MKRALALLLGALAVLVLAVAICDARKAEAVALKTRARLLEESILADEPREVVAFHALLLLQMIRARGMA